jgi:hypothetical protein
MKFISQFSELRCRRYWFLSGFCCWKFKKFTKIGFGRKNQLSPECVHISKFKNFQFWKTFKKVFTLRPTAQATLGWINQQMHENSHTANTFWRLDYQNKNGTCKRVEKTMDLWFGWRFGCEICVQRHLNWIAKFFKKNWTLVRAIMQMQHKWIFCHNMCFGHMGHQELDL